MVSTPESKIKRDIKIYLRSIGAHITPVKGGTFGKSGEADLVVCYKGRYIAIEGKTYEGEQSDWQITRMTQIRDAGGIYIIARCVDDVKRVCEQI